jgi:hypothetical protein
VLDDIALTGTYTNGKDKSLASTSFVFDTLSAVLNTGQVAGNFSISNLAQPTIDFDAKADISLYDLQELLQADTISSMNGQVNLDLKYHGTIRDIHKLSPKDFIFSKTKGDMTVSDVNIIFKNNHLRYNDINGQFAFNNNDVAVKKLSGYISKSQFEVKGMMKNMLSFLFLPDQPLHVTGNLQSTYIDLNELLKVNAADEDTNYRLAFPEKLHMDMQVHAQQVRFRKFKANEVKGRIKLVKQKLLFDPITMQTMDGTVSGAGYFDNTDDGLIKMKCVASVKDVDVHQAFLQCEDFGQSTLLADNIYGRATADVIYRSTWSSDLTLDLNSVYAKSNISIKDGELVRFKSLEALSAFVKMRDLIDVKFSTLQNQIEIKNQTVYIPSMEINSSAKDIMLEGEHTFNNEINYRIQILFSELLWESMKEKDKEIDGIPIQDDGEGRRKLYIIVTGTVDDPKYTYDRKSVVNKIKEDLKEEKQTVKQILHDEWGLFKKDTTLNDSPVEEEKPPKVQIIWDEEEDD